ncbi:MAG: hypothetical protein OXG25_01710 [Gammaproteobacteria bacterium]|nr:hypothetical protein [Gammaproteobacteria bacterium]
MPINEKAIKHFERVGRTIVASHVPDVPPTNFHDMLDRMFAINPNWGKGTNDSLGEDLPSHLAYLRFREAWIRKKEGRETA